MILRKFFIICDTVYPDDSGGRKLSLGRIFEAKESGFKVSVLHYNYTNSDVSIARQFFLEHNIDYFYYIPAFSHKKSNLVRCANYISSVIKLTPEPYYYIMKDYGFKKFVLDNFEMSKNSTLSIESILLSGLLPWFNTFEGSIELVFHNVESDFYRQLSISSRSIIYKIFFFIESMKLSAIEKYLFNIKDENIYFVFLSEKDLEKYRLIFPEFQADIFINKNNLFIKEKIKRSVNFNKPFFFFLVG